MKKQIYTITIIIVLLFIGFLVFNKSKQEEGQIVRVGWQTAWATQGQVVQALKHTDILEKNKLKAKFIGFSSGPPAIEAALAGSLDIVSGGSQPILQLVTRSQNWVIVSRHAYARLALLVPPDSKISSIEELEGKKIGLPVGSTAERFILLLAESRGLNTSNFEIVNLGIEEIGEFVRRGTVESWGEIDAVAGWEPIVLLLEREELGRVISEENEITLTAMSKDFIQNHREMARDYLKATILAWDYYANNRASMNEMFLLETSLPIGAELLDVIANNEPNAFVKNAQAVNIEIDDELKIRLQKTINFLAEKEIIQRQFDLTEVLNTDLLQESVSAL